MVLTMLAFCVPLATGLTATPAAAQLTAPQGGVNDPRQPGQRGDTASGQDDRSRQDQQQQQPSVQAPALIEPSSIDDPQQPYGTQSNARQSAARESLLEASQRNVRLAEPGEFELYVRRMIGRELPRFGRDLLLPSSRDFAVPATATIPPDYRVNVGDTISISLTGSAEGSVERTVDTNGNIFLSQVGSIHIAGVRQGDLRDFLARAIGTQFRNFRVGVRTTELRGVRVYITGFANNPGAFSVGSLSTLVNAVLQAGGPSAGGSFRSIKLIRGGREIAEFDLYQLLLNGNRANDPLLEDEDVILIPPAGPQVAVIGSVQQEAIYELRGSETLAEVLVLAGGATALSEPGRVISYRADPGSPLGPQQVASVDLASTPARPAQIVQVLPQGSLVQPLASQSVVVRIEGEVAKPGNYYVSPGTPLNDIVTMAGGLTSLSYPFGAKLVRQSIVEQQRENFQEALNQFELTLATAPLTADSSIDAGRQQAQLQGARETLARLREAEPDGRLVLDILPEATGLPGGLILENGDRILVPARPTSVGVFGAVFRPASFQISAQPLRIRDYLRNAGGTLRAADERNIIVVRANGSVLNRRNGALSARALPGDVIFVPVRTSTGSLLAKIGQITSILFQLGIGAATVAAIN